MKMLVALCLMFATSFAMADVTPIVPDLVGSSVVNGKKILVNAKGLTLYSYDEDKDGTSDCYGFCAVAWPPIEVTAAQAKTLPAPFTTTTRHDGSLQLRYDNKPLYLYYDDSSPGDTSGDGLEGTWHIVPDDSCLQE